MAINRSIPTMTKAPATKPMSTVSATPQVSGGPSTGNLTGDQKIYALEQKVAALEAQVGALLSVLTVDPDGKKARIKAQTLELESTMDLKVTAGMRMITKAGIDMKLEAGTEATVKCGSNLLLESGGISELKSPSITKITGNMVKVNNGSSSVARQNDPVAGNKILTGSSTFFA
ncbi:MAG: hypothetical protein KIT83_20665 [Bryobacterales bacterium]|nr:hypothetical protein [Bryobacterales bacterium]